MVEGSYLYLLNTNIELQMIELIFLLQCHQRTWHIIWLNLWTFLTWYYLYLEQRDVGTVLQV